MPGGPAANGPAPGGLEPGGAASGGPARGGPARGGPVPDGPAVGGPTANGPAHGGPAHGGPSPSRPAGGEPVPDTPAAGGSEADGPAASGPTAPNVAHGPWAGSPRGPAPGGEPEVGGEVLRPGEPENDALRRSGLQRQRAPWETPPTEPPGPASFPPAPQPRSPQPPTQPPTPQPPTPQPRSPQPPDPQPRSSQPRSPQPPGTPPRSPQPPGPQPPGFQPRNPEPQGVQPPGPPPPGFHAVVPRSGTSTEAPGAGTPASRTPSDSDSPPATLVDASSGQVPDQAPVQAPVQAANLPAPVDYVGSGPPTYDAEPTALPPADADDLDDLVADTVLDGASYGTSTLRAVSARGDSARYRGEPRRDSLLTARFGVGDGALVLVAMATGARATPGAHRAAAEACQWIGRAVGRSHARLAEDIRAARRGDLKSGLHRLTDRSLGKLRATAAEQGIEPEEYTASLRCLLLPADPECRTRVFFGVGAGGLFRLRDGEWQDIEPHVADTAGEAVVGFGSLPHETPDGDRLTMDLGITTPPSPYEPAPEPPPRDPFRFRASVARPGDTLLLCTSGLAEPLRGEPGLAEHLTSRWSDGDPPGLAAFLADTLVRVKGYADDRTAAAVWEA
ncbi:protein phosphatase 2C domain-containing protein [Streptomyces sp. NBC_00258]|uniref:protein phosphatase 2C domain-containing protein n=1 Tax=Streptomyces sp. NBC_00258 TaxID=2903642 RepID=UPI003FA77020